MTSNQSQIELEVIQTYYSQIKEHLVDLESYNVNITEINIFSNSLRNIADSVFSNPSTENIKVLENKIKLILFEVFEVLISKKIHIIEDIVNLNSDILNKYVPGFYNSEYHTYRETKRNLSTIDSNNLDNSLEVIEINLPFINGIEDKLTGCNPLLVRERRVNNIKDRKSYIIGFLTALVVALAAIFFKEVVFPDKKDPVKKEQLTEEPKQ